MEPSRMQITIRPIRKPKRFRSAFSTEQIKFLELQFKKFPYISSEHRKEIATSLNMQERAVKIWFQNRRMKEKKETINIEFDYVTTSKVEESGKSRLNNACTLPSVNKPLSHSLPIIMKPVDTSPIFNRTYTDSFHKETRENIETQQEPQNLSMNNIKSRKDNQDLKNIKHQLPFLNVGSTQRGNTPRKQFKNPQNIHRKPAECPILSERAKRSEKEINNSANLDHKPKVTRKLKAPSSIATKLKASVGDLISKKPIPQMPSRPPKQVNETTYFPMMSTMYAHPYMSSGGVIWKPVNIMPVVAPGMNVPSNQQRFDSQINNCGCNCHGITQPMTLPPNPINPYAQYVITTPAPFQNSHPRFQKS